jgi:ribosomal protein L5
MSFMNCFFFQNLNNVSDFSMIDRFFFLNVKSIPKLKNINVSLVIRDMKDEKNRWFTKAVTLIESITGRRPHILFYKKYLKGRGLRQCCYSVKASLTKPFFFNFLSFCVYFLFPYLSKDIFSLDLNRVLRRSNNIMVFLKEPTLFPGTLENFLKWPYPLSIIFLLNSYNVFYCYYILRNFFISFNSIL